MNVIINADDFGINRKVTNEISRLIKSGLISSTTIMANGTELETVMAVVASNPSVSFGVHVCLSEFTSLTKSEVFYKNHLTDASGEFVKKAIMLVRHPCVELKNAVIDEIEAQIETIRILGAPISHIDSHHHVHTINWLYPLFCEVAQRYGIKKMRLGQEFMDVRSKLHLFQYWNRKKLNKTIKNSFTAADMFMSYSNAVKYVETIKNNGAQTIELMCHPGHPAERYVKEIQEIENGLLDKVLDCRLISYNDL